MAQYTNLTDFTDLQVGDVIKYDTTTYGINFNNRKLKISLHGARAINGDSAYTGGLTEFIIDTKNLSKQFSVLKKYGNCVAYNVDDENVDMTTSDAKGFRIAVAGNSGACCNGGGIVSPDYIINLTDGTTYTIPGASQTSGYSFGTGNGGLINNRVMSAGAGWYGGEIPDSSIASLLPSTPLYFSTGGSGFIIGKTTTEYPSLYFYSYPTQYDDDMNSIVESIGDEYTCTTGTSEYYTNGNYFAIIEILESSTDTTDTGDNTDNTGDNTGTTDDTGSDNTGDNTDTGGGSDNTDTGDDTTETTHVPVTNQTSNVYYTDSNKKLILCNIYYFDGTNYIKCTTNYYKEDKEGE